MQTSQRIASDCNQSLEQRRHNVKDSTSIKMRQSRSFVQVDGDSTFPHIATSVSCYAQWSASNLSGTQRDKARVPYIARIGSLLQHIRPQRVGKSGIPSDLPMQATHRQVSSWTGDGQRTPAAVCFLVGPIAEGNFLCANGNIPGGIYRFTASV